MLDLAEILLSINGNQGEEAATRIISILQIEALDAEVLRSASITAADCENPCHRVAKVNIRTSGFDGRLLKAVEGLEANGYMWFQRELFKVLLLHVQLVWSADEFPFSADCCNKN